MEIEVAGVEIGVLDVTTRLKLIDSDDNLKT
jgi:hypothetical protein